jgi:enamine deaminase RidA (YjgF/YER057c/UK114 family)
MTEIAAKLIHPDGWLAPSGYSEGIVVPTGGRQVMLAGQIGWDPTTGRVETDDFAEQVRLALKNVATLLVAAGAEPRHLVRLTWFITSRDEYLAARKEIGQAYRELIGRHYPAMSVLIVAGLIEERAKLEIEATAVVPA